MRGARLLGGGLCHEDYRAFGPLPPKVIGNGLRELDRFLNLLIGEAAQALALPMVRDEANTANRLRRFREGLGLADPDHARLRAIGRSRACLFYCNGVVRRADEMGGVAMTAGWWSDAREMALRQVAIGERLTVSAGELAEICGFYEALGAAVTGVLPTGNV